MSMWQEMAFLVGLFLAAGTGTLLAINASELGWRSGSSIFAPLWGYRLFAAQWRFQRLGFSGVVSGYSSALWQWRIMLLLATALVGLVVALLIWVYWLPSSFGWDLARLLCVLPSALLAGSLWTGARD